MSEKQIKSTIELESCRWPKLFWNSVGSVFLLAIDILFVYFMVIIICRKDWFGIVLPFIIFICISGAILLCIFSIISNLRERRALKKFVTFDIYQLWRESSKKQPVVSKLFVIDNQEEVIEKFIPLAPYDYDRRNFKMLLKNRKLTYLIIDCPAYYQEQFKKMDQEIKKINSEIAELETQIEDIQFKKAELFRLSAS